MEHNSQLYSEICKAWKSTCKIVLGNEIGELKDYENYLKRYTLPYVERPSSLSGKKVLISPKYPENAKIFSNDETEKIKFEKIDINSIKDIDSLVDAVRENVSYAGNILFGNNLNTLYGNKLVNCLNVIYSKDVRNTKNSAFLECTREDSYCFGVSGLPQANFSIRCSWGININRCFEVILPLNLSDCYYCFNCNSCSDLMFCFGLKNKKYAIGNLQLEKSKYLKIKEKLIGEMAEQLESKKDLVSLLDICAVKDNGHEFVEDSIDEKVVPGINSAFAKTTRIMLGKELASITKYKKFLSKNLGTWHQKILGKGKKKVDIMLGGFHLFENIPSSKFLNEPDFYKTAEMSNAKISENDSFDIAVKKFRKTAYFTGEIREKPYDDFLDCACIYMSSHCYKVADATESKYCAYGSGVVQSEFCFGSGILRVLSSKFCISCNDVINCSNSFGLDSCYDTRNSFFCHNCENIDSGIFCFNLRSRKYAVGNTEVEREKYEKVKKILVDYILQGLEKKSDLDFDIFNVVNWKRKKN